MNQIVTVLGSSVVDLIFEIPKHYLISHGADHSIKLPFGSKLVAKQYAVTPGGSGANIATGLSRFGYEVVLRTDLSKDVFSQFLRESIERSGVSLVDSIDDDLTPISVVLSLREERTIITRSSNKVSMSAVSLPEEGWIHLGPLPEKNDELLQQIITHRLKTGQLMSMNPSMSQIEERSRLFVSILRTLDLLFVNMQEGSRLSRLPTHSRIEDVVRSLHSLGAKIVCVTDGERGAYVSNGIRIWHAPATLDKARRVDATGAGDAFTSGFISSYLEKQESEEDTLIRSLKSAMLNSGSVVGSVGAQEGLLTRKEIERDLGTVTIKVIK